MTYNPLDDPMNPHRAARKSAMPDYGLFGLLSGGFTPINRDLTRDDFGSAAAYQTVIAVNRANDLIANAVQSLTLELKYNETYDPANDKVIASTKDVKPRHPFMAAMKRATFHSHIPFLQQVTYALNLFDECYIEKIRNDFQMPTGVRWLNPLGMQVQEENGEIVRFQYSWNGQAGAPFQPDEIAYLHGFNPTHDNYGAGKTLAGMDEINIKRNLQRYLRAFFANYAVPAGLMSPDNPNTTWSKGDVERMTESLRDFYKGVANQFNTMVLPKGAKLANFDAPDIQKQYSVDDAITRAVFMLYGVPMAMAGDSNNSAYKDGEYVLDDFYTNTIIPLARWIAEMFNLYLVPFFDASGYTRCEFNEEAFDRTTEADLRKSQKANADYTGNIATLNEARQAAGYEPLEGGDSFASGVQVVEGKIVNFSQPLTPDSGMQLPGSTLDGTLPDNGGALNTASVDTTKDAQTLCVLISLANNPDLMQLQQRLKAMFPDPAVRWNEPDDFHITLLLAPSVDDAQIQGVVDYLNETPPPELALGVGSLACFDNVGEHALHFRVPRNGALLDYQAALYDYCEGAGLQMTGHSMPADYTPHITMGYLPAKVGRITFHGNRRVKASGVICSVKRGDDYDIVYPPAENEAVPEVIGVDGDDGQKALAIVHDDHVHTVPVETWDWSRDKARDELKSWYRFQKNGTKRAFEFRYLRGGYAEQIAAMQSDGQSAGTIVKALDLELTPGLTVLQSDALALFDMLLTDGEMPVIKSIGDLQSDFSGSFDSMLKDFRDGKPRNPDKAASILKFLNQNFIRSAFIEGLAEGGVTESPDDDDNTRIRELVSDANSYVDDFISKLYGDGISDMLAAGKADLWWKKAVMPAYYDGITSAKGNQMLEFTGEDGDESCDTCRSLKGQRHTARQWQRKKLRPQVDTTSFICGGWKCKHILTPTTGKSTGTWLS